MTVVVRPIVSWPRVVAPGRRYLMTVDLDYQGELDEWPYDVEEVVIHCLLDAGDVLVSEAIGDPAVVIHRFGGTYGPARFVLTPRPGATEGALRVTLVNDNGVPMRVLELGDVRIDRSGRAIEPGSRIELPARRAAEPPRAPEAPLPVVAVLEIRIIDGGLAAWRTVPVIREERAGEETLDLSRRRTALIDRMVGLLRGADDPEDMTTLDERAYREMLATVGTELFDLLFVGTLREELARQLADLLDRAIDQLRVKLRFVGDRADWLAALPWEFTHTPPDDAGLGISRRSSWRPGGFLAQRAGLIITRQISTPSRPLRTETRPISVLLVSSSPTVEEPPGRAVVKTLEWRFAKLGLLRLTSLVDDPPRSSMTPGQLGKIDGGGPPDARSPSGSTTSSRSSCTSWGTCACRPAMARSRSLTRTVKPIGCPRPSLPICWRTETSSW